MPEIVPQIPKETGSFEDYVVPRIAVGFTIEQVQAMLSKDWQVNISTSELSEFIAKRNDKIAAKRFEINKFIKDSTPNAIARLNDLSEEIKHVLDTARETGDYKIYIAGLAPYLKNLELVAKALGELKESTELDSTPENDAIAVEFILDELEKDGSLNVSDKEKAKARLRKILGVRDE